MKWVLGVLAFFLLAFFILYAATSNDERKSSEKFDSVITPKDVSACLAALPKLEHAGIVVRLDPSRGYSSVIVGQSFYALSQDDKTMAMEVCAVVARSRGGTADLEILDWRDNRKMGYYQAGAGLFLNR